SGLFVRQIGGEIWGQKNNYNKKKAIRGMDYGIVIQKFLLNRTKPLIPLLKNEAVVTTEKFQSGEDLLDINLIISTQDSLETAFPVGFVNPLMTDDDLIRVLKVTRGNYQPWGRDGSQEKIKHCIKQVAHHCDHKDQLMAPLDNVFYKVGMSELLPQKK
ncbi:BglG family transcription antiterminator, partial [Streptococcus pluranimalium]